jgi:hypothetical protein
MKKYLTLKNLGWLLTAITVFMVGMSGISKLFATEEMVKNFEFMKLTPYMALLGVVELGAVGLLVVPRTSIYGAVLIGSYMSGAVAVHLSLMGGAGIFIPILLGVLAWSSHCLRTHKLPCSSN